MGPCRYNESLLLLLVPEDVVQRRKEIRRISLHLSHRPHLPRERARRGADTHFPHGGGGVGLHRTGAVEDEGDFGDSGWSGVCAHALALSQGMGQPRGYPLPKPLAPRSHATGVTSPGSPRDDRGGEGSRCCRIPLPFPPNIPDRREPHRTRKQPKPGTIYRH